MIGTVVCKQQRGAWGLSRGKASRHALPLHSPASPLCLPGPPKPPALSHRGWIEWPSRAASQSGFRKRFWLGWVGAQWEHEAKVARWGTPVSSSGASGLPPRSHLPHCTSRCRATRGDPQTHRSCPPSRPSASTDALYRGITKTRTHTHTGWLSWHCFPNALPSIKTQGRISMALMGWRNVVHSEIRGVQLHKVRVPHITKGHPTWVFTQRWCSCWTSFSKQTIRVLPMFVDTSLNFKAFSLACCYLN